MMEEGRGKMEEGQRIAGNRQSLSSHSEREGEALPTWLVEGATQAPGIDRGKP